MLSDGDLELKPQLVMQLHPQGGSVWIRRTGRTAYQKLFLVT